MRPGEDSVSSPSSPAVLLTFATVSWQKGSAAQVVSLVHELRRVRPELRFRLLSHWPAIDRGPARRLGIEVVDPGFPPAAGRNRRSLAMLAGRLTCAASGRLGVGRPSAPPGSRKPLAAAYAGSDLVLDLSGDSYRDPPGGFAPAHHANLLAALAAGTPYALVSQSLGPFRSWNRPVVRHLLNRASLVYIRERRTRELLLRVGVRPDRLRLAPDVAFALPAASPAPIWASEGWDPAVVPRPWVGLSISLLALRLAKRRNGNRYLEEIVRLCQHVRSKYGASLLVIPHEVDPSGGGPDDRSAAEVLFETLGRPAWMHSIRGDYDPSCLKGLIGECDALVASRMHAAIAGLSSGVPTVAAAWSHKYEGVLLEIGLADFVWDQRGPDAPRLDTLFDRLWLERDRIRSRLVDYTARARLEIAETIARLAACLPEPALRDLPAPSVRRQTGAGGC